MRALPDKFAKRLPKPLSQPTRRQIPIAPFITLSFVLQLEAEAIRQNRPADPPAMMLKPLLRSVRLRTVWGCVLSLSLAVVSQAGTISDPPVRAVELKKLGIEELFDVQILSVSKHPERLAGAASAIQVITQEDIRRAGVEAGARGLAPAVESRKPAVNTV